MSDPVQPPALSSAWWNALRCKCEDDRFTELWRLFLADTRSTMQRFDQVTRPIRDREMFPERGNNPEGKGDLGWCSVTPAVIEAALAHRLDGEARWLKHVVEAIGDYLKVCDNPNAFLSNGERLPVLSHGEVALAASMTWTDLPTDMHESLSGLLRDRVLDDHAFDAVLQGWTGGSNTPITHCLQNGLVAMGLGPITGRDDVRPHVDKACDVWHVALRHGYDEAGYSYEGTGYGHGVLWQLYWFAYWTEQYTGRQLYRETDRLRRAALASRHLAFPDVSSLMNPNDKGTCRPHSMPWLLLAAKWFDEPRFAAYWHDFQGPGHPVRPFGGRNSLLFGGLLGALLWWDGSERPTRPQPYPTRHVGHGTGTANVRTSWSPTAVHVNLLGSGRSRNAWGHAHGDAGHFSIFAGGEYLAIDPGRYNAAEDHHSVVLVEGRDAHGLTDGKWHTHPKGGQLLERGHNDVLDYFLIDATEQKRCTWADRHALFVRDVDDFAYLLLLDDINVDNASHRYVWQLQANHHARIETDADDRHARVIGKNMRLDLTFGQPGELSFQSQPHTMSLSQDVRTWAWPYGRKDGESPAAMPEDLMWDTSPQRPRLLAEQTGLQGQLVTVIVPRRVDQPAVSVAIEPLPAGFRVMLDVPSGRDTIHLSPRSGLIELENQRIFSPLHWRRADRHAGEQTFQVEDF